MRIISQSGSLDMPYELVELEILEVKNELKTMYSKGFMVVACAPCNHANLIDLSKNHVLGVYSTGENAKKAMEMCREKYLSRMELDGGYDIVNKCYVQPNYWVLPKAFQFPKEEEV